MKEYWDLFTTFMRIGGFTFGGGYAMLPMIQKEVVERRKWATEDDVMDYFAVAQCTPGVIAVNTATFVGHKQKGIPGAIAATLGVITPSVIIITIIALFLSNFRELEVVNHAFGGITVCVCVLIANAVWGLWKKNVKGKRAITIFAIALAVMLLLDPSPVFVVVGAALTGLAFGKKDKGGAKK